MIGPGTAVLLALATAVEDSAVLEQRIRANDYRGAQALAKELGAEAVPVLEGVARTGDERERTLALFCLEAAQGDGAARTAAQALFDAAPEVRAAALQILWRRDASGALPEVLRATEANVDPTVRRTAILIAGRTPGTADRLARSCRDRSGPVEDACTAALAKRGDEQAKRRFVRFLSSARGGARTPALDLAEYVRAPWLLGSLAPLLSDRSPSLRIGADGAPGPEYLRVCDRAVNLIARIAQPRWSFPAVPAANYTDAQLGEVRRWLRSRR